MAKEAVVSARAAIAAVMIFLTLVMDVSWVVQREDRSAMSQPRGAECDTT